MDGISFKDVPSSVATTSESPPILCHASPSGMVSLYIYKVRAVTYSAT